MTQSSLDSIISESLINLSLARLKSLASTFGATDADRRSYKSLSDRIAAASKGNVAAVCAELTIAELRMLSRSLGGMPMGNKRAPIERLLSDLWTKKPRTIASIASKSSHSSSTSIIGAPPVATESFRDLDAEIREILLNRSESQFFDRKARDKKPGELAHTLVAFANAEGGELVVGVHDQKSKKSDKLDGFHSEEEANALLQASYFGAIPAIAGLTHRFYRYRDSSSGHFRYIVVLDVPRSTTIHYSADHRCFIRRGAQTSQVPDSQISALSFARGSASYEDTPLSGYGASALLAHEAADRYLKRLAVTDGLRFLKTQRLLGSTSQTNDEYVTTAAALLLDDCPQASVSTKCAIKVTRLETAEATYDRKWVVGSPHTIEGDLETLIYEAIKYVKSVLESIKFDRAGELVQLSFPSEALHELIANAVLHRDYSVKDDVHIRIYNNRIEIQSPGRLPGPVTVENIREQHFARNPKIVRLLSKLPSPPNRDIGEGIDTVISKLRDAKLRDPEFRDLDHGFLVVLRHEPNATPQERILSYLSSEAGRTITNRIARDLTGIGSENAVKRVFTKLKSDGMIEVADPKAGKQLTAYRLTRRGRSRSTVSSD